MNIRGWVVYILFIASYNFLLAVEVQEQKIWEPAEEPKTYKEARDLYEESEKEQKRAQEILDDKRANQDAKDQALLDQERALRDKTVAELGMARSPDGWEQIKNEDFAKDYDDPSTFISKKRQDLNQSNEKILSDAFAETKQKLASTVTVIKYRNDFSKAADDVSAQVQQTIAMVDLAKSPEEKTKISTLLGEINNSVDTIFNRQDIEREVAKQTNLFDKLDIIHNQQDKLNLLRNIVDKEQARPKVEKDFRYDAQLNNLAKTLEVKLDQLTETSIATRKKAKPESWISEKISQFKNWFDRTFDFHKSRLEKRSINEELKMIQDIKNKSENREAIFLVEDVKNVNSEANVLKERIQEARSSEAGNLKIHAEELLKSLESLEKQTKDVDFKKQLGSYADLYNDAKAILNDLQAKSNRYRGDNPTLFYKLAKIYEKEWGKETGYGIADAYKILGVSSDASLEEIIKAYQTIESKRNTATEAEKKKIAAARNASNILTNPIERMTYDAFLKDYYDLIGGDKDRSPLRPQDVLEGSISEDIKNYLNKKGELSKLEILADEYKKICGVERACGGGAAYEALNLQPNVIIEGISGTTDADRTKFLFKQIEEAKNLLNDAIKIADEKLLNPKIDGP